MSRRRRSARKMWQDDQNEMPWWLGWAFVGIVVALWANRRRQEREERTEYSLSTTWTDAGPAAVPDISSPVAIVEDIPIRPPEPAPLEPAEPLETTSEVVEAIDAAGSGDVQLEEGMAGGRPADDLTRIDGIGPRISSVLQAAGITTFAALADTDAEHVREIVRAVGLNLADPTTWPDQARLAAAGDWEGLKRLQDNLKGGRPV